MPARSSSISHVISVGLVSAGLFAAVLGATGATAQEEAASSTPTPTPAAAALIAEPTPEAAAPAALPEASPTSTPAEAAPAATADAPAPDVTPEASPEAPAATPESTSAPAATPDATATPGSAATPAPERPRKRRGARERAADDAEACPDGLSSAVVDAEAGLDGEQPSEVTELSDAFPEEASTSDSACESDEDDESKKKKETRSKKKDRHDSDHHEPKVTPRPTPTVLTDGTPAQGNPSLSLAEPGPARIGVPNFFIEKFRIPPFLLPIYQAAGMQYGIRWELLAAINEIETDYGRNLNVSSAGALGWMQFMPATWKAYGVDANKDGVKDPFNPVDAIFASARYLRAAGGDKDVRKAVFAYNHANWYVDSVLMRARLIGGLPVDFVGSLTGLTQGRFPVHAKATYADAVDVAAARKVKRGNVANVVASDGARRHIDVFAKQGSPVVAVNDGRVLKVGETPRLGRFVQIQDVYGNTFTYGDLGSVAATYPAPRERNVSAAKVRRELDLPRDPRPTRAATAGKATRTRATVRRPAPISVPAPAPAAAKGAAKQRLFANPKRPNARRAGGDLQLMPDDYAPAPDDLVRFDPEHYVAKPLREGARIIGGTILGRIGARTERTAAHLKFEIRPAGRGAPRVDPKPILDGWKLLESTAVYRARGKNPFFGDDADAPTIGQILLMSKETLERRVLANPRVDLYACGRDSIRSGAIDRRVLAALEYLASSGLRPTVSSLRCGREGRLTASGNVSQHSTGDAVDIAAVNGTPILGNQGRGSITETAIQRLLTLQGTMKPDQIISLMTFEGAPNTIAMGDHADHIHVGWRPLYASGGKADRKVRAILKPKQWIKLIDRLSDIDNPEVGIVPSKYAVRTRAAR